MSSEFLACWWYNDDGWLCMDDKAFRWNSLADLAETNGNISTGLLYMFEAGKSDDICSSLVDRLRICLLMQFVQDFLLPAVDFSFRRSGYGSLRLDLICILSPLSTFPLKIFIGIVEYWIGIAATSTLNLETFDSINSLQCYSFDCFLLKKKYVFDVLCATFYKAVDMIF